MDLRHIRHTRRARTPSSSHISRDTLTSDKVGEQLSHSLRRVVPIPLSVITTRRDLAHDPTELTFHGLKPGAEVMTYNQLHTKQGLAAMRPIS